MLTLQGIPLCLLRGKVETKIRKNNENESGNRGKLVATLYTTSLSDFGEYILLTNFNNYVDIFCEQFKLPQPGYGANMRMATAENITIINFGMGSPNAAIIMDLLSAIEPKACLFLGKCGESLLKRNWET